jgi:hypothetical protein
MNSLLTTVVALAGIFGMNGLVNLNLFPTDS